jgi:hypothetical protein
MVLLAPIATLFQGLNIRKETSSIQIFLCLDFESLPFDGLPVGRKGRQEFLDLEFGPQL